MIKIISNHILIFSFQNSKFVKTVKNLTIFVSYNIDYLNFFSPSLSQHI